MWFSCVILHTLHCSIDYLTYEYLIRYGCGLWFLCVHLHTLLHIHCIKHYLTHEYLMRQLNYGCGLWFSSVIHCYVTAYAFYYTLAYIWIFNQVNNGCSLWFACAIYYYTHCTTMSGSWFSCVKYITYLTAYTLHYISI